MERPSLQQSTSAFSPHRPASKEKKIIYSPERFTVLQEVQN
jgi:hypothetical protein